ncbi:hypothetical protein [Erythrobacter donghaensis]|uniref:hypothetical protein n=1 Tax=Erythrobacter donghaensis TaxID=267135 RepID=UPI000A3717DF|nr:hypothetical protein [Erythrobacter donghaensis]
MHYLVLPLVLALLGASDAPPAPAQPLDEPPVATIRELRSGFQTGQRCPDSNLPTGDNPGRQPRFERGPATADMGQMIYAVDRRIDGCSVVLVKGGGPAPTPPLGRIQLSPEQMAELPRKR